MSGHSGGKLSRVGVERGRPKLICFRNWYSPPFLNFSLAHLTSYRMWPKQYMSREARLVMPFKPRAWERWRDWTPRRKPVGLQTTAQPSLGSQLIGNVDKDQGSHQFELAEPDKYVPDMKVAMWQTTVLQCLQRLGINNHTCQNVCLTTNG